jgi:hypothetical protein
MAAEVVMGVVIVAMGMVTLRELGRYVSLRWTVEPAREHSLPPMGLHPAVAKLAAAKREKEEKWAEVKSLAEAVTEGMTFDECHVDPGLVVYEGDVLTTSQVRVDGKLVMALSAGRMHGVDELLRRQMRWLN